MAISITNVGARNKINRANHLTFDAVDPVDGRPAVAAGLHVYVKYSKRTEEIVAYRGIFVSPFFKTSRLEEITNGYRFHLMPFGGWPDSARLIFGTGASVALALGETDDWGWIGDAVTESEDYGAIVAAVTETEDYGPITDFVG